jgi:hypothetical protein
VDVVADAWLMPEPSRASRDTRERERDADLLLYRLIAAEA